MYYCSEVLATALQVPTKSLEHLKMKKNAKKQKRSYVARWIYTDNSSLSVISEVDFYSNEKLDDKKSNVVCMWQFNNRMRGSMGLQDEDYRMRN